MNWEFSVLATVLVPLVGSFALPLVGLMSRGLRNALAVLLGVATVFFALSLLPSALAGETHVFERPVGLGMDIVLVVDGLAVLMAIVSSFVSTLIIIYSLGYIKEYDAQQEYYLMVVLFLGSMMGLVFSANLLLMYVFWEITGICSWRLIGFFRERDVVIKADKAFLTTFGGAVFMLLGFALVYAQTGTLNVVAMKGVTISALALWLIIIGMFAKSATLPFHTWLPDAGVAPTTVTALLHAAVLVKIGVYAFARLFNVTFTLPPGAAQTIILVALLSTIVSACAALVERNIKRILAYSTVSQIGYIFMGLATLNPLGAAGALLFILMHGLSKAGLFLSAGVIEHGTGTKDITRMGGLSRVMPVTALAFLFCLFSVVGVPPFGGFYSKGLVIQGLMESARPIVTILAILSALLTAGYLLRVFVLVFLGTPRDHSIHPHREGTPVMVWVVAALGIFSLLSGLLVHFPEELVREALTQFSGGLPVHHAAEVIR